MRPSPYALVTAALAITALSCSTLGAPTAVPAGSTTELPPTPYVEPTQPVPPSETPSADSTTVPIEPTATPQLEVVSSVERYWEETESENAYTAPVTHTLSLSVPVLRASDPADPPTAAFNSIVSAKVSEMTSAFVNDLALYPPDPAFSGGVGSFFSVGASRFALDARVVSLRLDVAGYVAGAAHPYSFSQTINFDFATSRELALADLFAPGVDYLGPISAVCIAELETTDFFLGFEAGAAPDELNYRSWNLTDDGVLISFDPYQVGPYAAGPQEIRVPYSDLAGLIDPAGPAGAFLP